MFVNPAAGDDINGNSTGLHPAKFSAIALALFVNAAASFAS
ncbi:MAG TPA: hypothetical protein V6C90_23855 [Coleofasciculaceae cyanobacterium]